MTLEGKWEQVSGENRRELLEALEVTKETLDKLGTPSISLDISRAEGGGWCFDIMVGQMNMKSIRKVGERRPLAAHAPNYWCIPTKLTDTSIEEDLVDKDGAKHGTVNCTVSGDKMTIITSAKGIQSTADFKRK